MTAKSSVDSVRKDMISEMLIPIPPKDEQLRISKLLRDTDELISSLENIIEKKKLIKQGVMQQLLTGKKRLPGFSGKWEEVSVDKLTKFHKQGYFTQENYKVNGRYYLLRGTDMQNPDIDLSSTPKINSNETDYKNYKVEKGDFLIVRSGSIGRYGIVKDLPDSILGSYLILFRFDQLKLDNGYFGYFYESEISVRQLLTITQGSSNPNINAENIKSLRIPLPPTLNEQIAIRETLDKMDSELKSYKQKLNKYKNIKLGMMQVLLKGRIRLV
jgi:type I restriction enzyme S subunit